MLYVSQTPLRISFFSGGDMKAFYTREPGYCLSATINKYIYCVLTDHHPKDGLRMMYDTTEDVNNLDELKNSLARETIRYMGINDKHFTIASMSNVKSSGNGLGSSSAFTVGLLNVINKWWNGEAMDKWYMAKAACDIEINRLKAPIGRQDQYAAACGGVNLWQFNEDSSVENETCSKAQRNLVDLSSHLMLVYSGKSHIAGDILRNQNEAVANDEKKFDLLKANAYRARMGYELLKHGKFNDFGELMDEAWRDKKALVEGISTPWIDEIYDTVRRHGCTGGKILGAGGGGFFLFYFPYEMDLSVTAELLPKDFPETRVYYFDFVSEGSKLIMG